MGYLEISRDIFLAKSCPGISRDVFSAKKTSLDSICRDIQRYVRWSAFQMQAAPAVAAAPSRPLSGSRAETGLCPPPRQCGLLVTESVALTQITLAPPGRASGSESESFHCHESLASWSENIESFTKAVLGNTWKYKALYLHVPPYSGVQDFWVLPCTAIYCDASTCGIARHYCVQLENRVNAGMYQYVLVHTSS